MLYTVVMSHALFLSGCLCLWNRRNWASRPWKKTTLPSRTRCLNCFLLFNRPSSSIQTTEEKYRSSTTRYPIQQHSLLQGNWIPLSACRPRLFSPSNNTCSCVLCRDFAHKSEGWICYVLPVLSPVLSWFKPEPFMRKSRRLLWNFSVSMLECP